MKIPTSLVRVLAVLALVLLSLPTQAARLALVIGNDAYQFVRPLRNAAADADTMAVALRKAGYTVILQKNRDLKQTKDDIRAFRARVAGGDEVVLYFSGHGVQLGSDNYLLPIDVRNESENQVRDDGLALTKVLRDIKGAQPALTLAVIDACRNNPFEGKGNGKSIGEQGLTGVAGATGQIVIYAAGEGQKALDRLSDTDPIKNGLFTRVFVKEMERPGVRIDQVLRNVRVEVHRQAQTVRHEQVPAIYDQMLGDFYFVPGAAPVRISSAEEVEQEFWSTIKDSRDAQDFRDYERRYPSGRFLPLAQRQLRVLTVAPVQVASIRPEPVVQPVPQVVAQPQPASPPAAQSARSCAECPEMVVIPGGSFQMDSSDGYANEKPMHSVSIKSFEFGKYEVTQGQWKAVMGSNPSKFTECGDTCPVEQVSWDDIQEYLKKLNARSGQQYRLPSEAEWEYAARAGSSGKWSFGSDEGQLGEYGWYSANSASQTHRVGQKKPNGFGVYDLHGNVWEWVQDCWHGDYKGSPSDGSAWTSSCSSNSRVLRGGSWGSVPAILRSADRDWGTPGVRSGGNGFRLARTLFTP